MALTESAMADITVKELDRETLKRIADTIGFERGAVIEKGMLVTGSEAEVGYLVSAVRRFARKQERDEKVISLLLEGVKPGVMGLEHMLQLRRQAAARESFLRDVGLLDSSEVGELLGSEARNRSAMASRLKREGKLFAVTFRGADLYPAAQIVDGEPSSAIPEILEVFTCDSPWTVAVWLNAPSGWLDGEKPIELLATDPDRVVRAAHKSTEALRF